MHAACCRTILLALFLTWSTCSCLAVQIHPITSVGGWEAEGSWVLNARRTIAVAKAVRRNELRVLQLTRGSWSLADVITPPEPDRAELLAGSIKLSDDARYLVVAAASRPGSTQQQQGKQQQLLLQTQQGKQRQQQQQLTAGYVYRVVAHSQSQAGFRYQLASRLSLPLSGTVSGIGNVTGSARVDMSADGQTFIACWTQTLTAAHAAASGAAAQEKAGAAGEEAGAVAAQQQLPVVSSGGAAVFTWRRQGQALQAAPLVPTGSTRFGEACQLSETGSSALVLDGGRGAWLFARATTSPRSFTPGYRAAGWLPGAPAQQQYQVLTAELSPSGRRAVLLVQQQEQGQQQDHQQHTQQGHQQQTQQWAGSSVALKVFVADSLGHWKGVCSIPLPLAAVNAAAGGASAAASVMLGEHSRGLNVWLTLHGHQRMYDIALQGTQLLHCPVQPVLQTLPDAPHSPGSTSSSPGSTSSSPSSTSSGPNGAATWLQGQGSLAGASGQKHVGGQALQLYAGQHPVYIIKQAIAEE